VTAEAEQEAMMGGGSTAMARCGVGGLGFQHVPVRSPREGDLELDGDADLDLELGAPAAPRAEGVGQRRYQGRRR
jgi:hypothetical protein